MTFTEHLLQAQLPTLSSKGKFYLAYSGGLDSHVLLFAISRLNLANPIVALHVNHGLSSNADTWQNHCEKVCSDLELEFNAHKVTINHVVGESLENLARKERYAVFEEVIGKDDFLLMGHHQDDQLETILFRLMRGSGPKGLSAIPQQRALGKGHLCRPLLAFSRNELLAYAEHEKLTWIEDESNKDTRFDRNFLRQEILPLLKERWPGFEKSWQRSAQLSHEADVLQTVLGEQDLALARTEHQNRLNIASLKDFDPIRLNNLLRVWFVQLNRDFSIPMPDYQSLQRIMNEVLPAVEDAEPLVTWSSKSKTIEVRRFAKQLYVLEAQSTAELNDSLEWDMKSDLSLPNNLGALRLKEVQSNGIDFSTLAKISIRFRQGGEQAKPVGRKTRPLKKIFQDYGVPPWRRNKVPLLYSNEDLIAVADLFICENYCEQAQAEKGKKLHQIYWEKPDIHCCY